MIILGHLLNSMDEEVTYHLSARLGYEVLYYETTNCTYFNVLSYKKQHLGNEHLVSTIRIVTSPAWADNWLSCSSMSHQK